MWGKEIYVLLPDSQVSTSESEEENDTDKSD